MSDADLFCVGRVNREYLLYTVQVVIVHIFYLIHLLNNWSFNEWFFIEINPSSHRINFWSICSMDLYENIVWKWAFLSYCIMYCLSNKASHHRIHGFCLVLLLTSGTVHYKPYIIKMKDITGKVQIFHNFTELERWHEMAGLAYTVTWIRNIWSKFMVSSLVSSYHETLIFSPNNCICL